MEINGYIFNEGIIPTIYQERLELLRKNHIALWDSIDSCIREGSLDSAICDEVPNDFKALFAKYPKIKTICFNGGKSFQCFKKYNKDILKDKTYTFILCHLQVQQMLNFVCRCFKKFGNKL